MTCIDPREVKDKKHVPCEMIRHDTMKEILGQALRDNESDATNIVSTIQPSRVDGFLNGLNVLLYGRGGYYQVKNMYSGYPTNLFKIDVILLS